MSADGQHCECGNLAVFALRWRDTGTSEPICEPCLARIAPSQPQRKAANDG